jgi:hypothetical protein
VTFVAITLCFASQWVLLLLLLLLLLLRYGLSLETFGFHKRRDVYRQGDKLSVAHEGLCSVDLVNTVIV